MFARCRRRMSLAGALALATSPIHAAARPTAGGDTAVMAPTTDDDSAPAEPERPDRADASAATTTDDDRDPCATADDPDTCRLAARAARHFAAGQQAFREGRFLEAAAAFERSYASVAAPETLFNAAFSYERAGEAVRAIRAYETYLRIAPADAPGRSHARSAVDALKRQVGRIVLLGARDDRLREIRVDGRALDPRDASSVYVAPGRVEVALVTRDGTRRRRTFDIEAGQTVVLPLDSFLPPPPRPERPPRSPAPPPEGPDPDMRRATWGLLGATLTTAAAMTVTGSLALVEARRFNEGKCSEVCTPEELAEHPEFPAKHRDRARALATTTNVLVGVVAALAIATLSVGLAARKPRPRREGTRRSVRRSPWGRGLSRHRIR